MRAALSIILLSIFLVGCGCHKDTDTFLENAGNANDGFTNDFGRLLIEKNFAKAYMMTSPEYQKGHSEVTFQQAFEKAQQLLAPGRNLTQVQVSHGELPTSEPEATSTYQFPPDIIEKKSTWKNWNIAELSDKDGQGFSVFHLVMDDGTGPKIGVISYERL